MKRWFKVVDPRDMTDMSGILTEMYGYPWAGADNNWYYSCGIIHGEINYFHVFVMDRGHDHVLTKLGFKTINSGTDSA